MAFSRYQAPFEEKTQVAKEIINNRVIARLFIYTKVNQGPDIAWFKDPDGNILSILQPSN